MRRCLTTLPDMHLFGPRRHPINMAKRHILCAQQVGHGDCIPKLTYKSTLDMTVSLRERSEMMGDVGQMPENWNAAIPAMSTDGLLLAELSHRVRNEVCASIGAMRLSRSRRGVAGREEMVDAAIARLEAFGEVLGVMSVPPGKAFRLKEPLERMCDGLRQGRAGLERAMVTVDAADVLVTGEAGQRIMMIAHELVHNAMRHAMDGRRGLLAVVLRGNSREVRLAVVDDGPGIRRGSGNGGSGMGSIIVEELVRRGGGSIDCSTGEAGTRVRVRMPGTSVISRHGA